MNPPNTTKSKGSENQINSPWKNQETYNFLNGYHKAKQWFHWEPHDVSTFCPPWSSFSILARHQNYLCWGNSTLLQNNTIKLLGVQPRPKISPGDSNIQPMLRNHWSKAEQGRQGKWVRQTGRVLQIRGSGCSGQPATTRGFVINECCRYSAPGGCCHKGIGAHCFQVFRFSKNTRNLDIFNVKSPDF